MKILMVKTSALGDVIHTFPTVAYLKRCYPDAQLDWVVEESLAGLVAAHPLVDRVIPIATRQWRKRPWRRRGWREARRAIGVLRQQQYDLLFDLQGNIKSGVVTLCARAHLKVGFGWRTVPEWPNLLATGRRYNPPAGHNIREDYLWLARQVAAEQIEVGAGSVELETTAADRELVRHLVGRRGLQVVVCPGSAWKNKQLTEESLLEFLTQMQGEYQPHFLWVWGSDQERAVAERLRAHFPDNSVVVPKLPLPGLQHLMWRVDCVIAMDSLALHLAGTTPTPSFSFFGPSNPDKYRPVGPHSHLQGSCPYGRTFTKRCPVLRTCNSGACMRELSGGACFQAFTSWWKSSRRQTLAHLHKKQPPDQG